MTIGNTSAPVASTGAGYGQWLAQLMLQRKAMEGQAQNMAELLKAMPSPESHLGQQIDIRL
jgi:hypothetical protein